LEIDVNKAELIASIAGSTGNTKTTVSQVLEAMETIACNTLSGGDEVTLPGIGKLTPVKKAARTARNPRTGDKIEKPATTVVKFRVAKSLKDLVA
jgi:DNA-binding protein HU-beta